MSKVMSKSMGFKQEECKNSKQFDKTNHLKLLKKAFLQCAKLKQKSGLEEDPGCSFL
jgi:hypothetical protein